MAGTRGLRQPSGPPTAPVPGPARRHPGGWLVLGAALLFGLAGLVLYYFPPDQYAFYPRCALHRLTGLHCPGCGSLRALHHLAHAELGAAFRCNPLLVVALPLVALWVGASLGRGRAGRARGLGRFGPFWFWLGVGAVGLFGLLRNLPFAPFNRWVP